MKIGTKALTSLLIIAMISLSTATASSLAPKSNLKQQGAEKKLERVVRHHDRKLELRASVLGLTAGQLREELRVKSFDTVLKQHGFKSRQSFYMAVTGKVKDELRRRGWSDQKIEKFQQKRLSRFAKLMHPSTTG